MNSLRALAIDWQWDVVWDRIPLLWDGLRITLLLAFVSMAIALVLGMAIAVMRLSRIRAVSLFAAGYVNLFRAIPLLVFIVWVYYGLPIMLNIDFPPLVAGVICLSLQYGGWLAEIFRSGIQAVPKGQREASLALSMTRPRTFFSVVLPQTVRIVTPSVGNMFVGMLKDSTLVSFIGVFEIFRRAEYAANQTFRYFEFYTALLVIFVVLTTLVSFGVRILERRMHTHDVLAVQPRPWSMLRRRRRLYLEDLSQGLAGQPTAGANA